MQPESRTVIGGFWRGGAALGSAQPTVSEETLAEKEESAVGSRKPVSLQGPNAPIGQAGTPASLILLPCSPILSAPDFPRMHSVC